ncbi:MAG: hypothetical protein NT061_02200 [Spirochaetes bacterium]|nr:hypothetical protein [Spirochaetota bacterium]
MLSELLAPSDWSTPPDAMEFSASYGELIRSIASLVAALSLETSEWHTAHDQAVSLYVRSPGIVNVMLNYKICVEHDLPLHPTVYYELKEARKYRIDYDLPTVEKANRLYRRSIELARASLRLDPDFSFETESFLGELPAELPGFVYTEIRDQYTWRGSEPELLERLAAKLRASWEPELIVAAAHGSIMPALLLAEILGVPLYFIRFSMFKRHDEEPIVTFSDKAWLYSYRDAKVLLYDEDVAGGRTLSIFSERLGKLFSTTRTACSIRHAGASVNPDFCGRVWWD